MFGVNKKLEEKEQEMKQALSSKQAEIDGYANKLAELAGSMQSAWQQAEEGFASIEEGQKELAGKIKGLAKSVSEAGDKARSHSEKAKSLQRQAGKLARDAEKSESGGKKSLARIQRQEKEILEIVQQYEKVVSPAEIIKPAASGIREDIMKMQEQVDSLEDLGKQMEMRALHAAIEAGRLGEEGREFVGAAEEVRALSGQYSWFAAFLSDKMKHILSKLQEAEGQAGQLAQLLKNQNVRLEKAAAEISGSVGQLEAPDASQFISGIRELVEGIEEAADGSKELAGQCSQAADNIGKAEKEQAQRQKRDLRSLRDQAKEATECLQAAKA